MLQGDDSYAKYFLEETHENVREESSLVNLVQHDDRVASQQRVGHHLSHQNTLSHVLQRDVIESISSRMSGWGGSECEVAGQAGAWMQLCGKGEGVRGWAELGLARILGTLNDY